LVYILILRNSNLQTQNGGFTLIELLVVIAIIGLLASIIFASLTSSREKSQNAAVKSNMITVRSQAELYYNNNNQSYGIYSGACPTNSGSGHVFLDTVVVRAISAAKNAGASNATCWANGNQWSASVQFKTPESGLNFWCVDSNSAGRAITSPPTGTLCP
jgi:prepilin-type N-terminal cleavage/methylation domain-containing protein